MDRPSEIKNVLAVMESEYSQTWVFGFYFELVHSTLHIYSLVWLEISFIIMLSSTLRSPQVVFSPGAFHSISFCYLLLQWCVVLTLIDMMILLRRPSLCSAVYKCSNIFTSGHVYVDRVFTAYKANEYLQSDVKTEVTWLTTVSRELDS
jgi:hypothetical protein